MNTLTKKQIDNILAWLGKSYPVEMRPPINIKIEIMLSDFTVTTCVFDGKVFHDMEKYEGVVAWRHIKHKG